MYGRRKVHYEANYIFLLAFCLVVSFSIKAFSTHSESVSTEEEAIAAELFKSGKYPEAKMIFGQLGMKDLVKEYQLVEAHASMTDNGERYRMNVMLQPPETRKRQKQEEKRKQQQKKR